jgi:hypothetical protein
MNNPITAKMIQQSELINDSAKTWALDNIAYMQKNMRFFGSSTKVEKGAEKRETYIIYLQPHNKVAKQTVCAFAELAGCAKACLISSGMLGMTTGQSAATKRTILMLLCPEYFEACVLSEIDRAELKALKSSIPALFRMNGTSDCDFSHIIAQRPNSAFYDYTKILSRIRKNTLANYDLTFSGSMYSEQSKSALSKAIVRDHRIAMAVNTKGLVSDKIQLPDGFADFDQTDLRPLDPAGAFGLLKRKGSSKAERALETAKSFFITADNLAEFNNIIARAA